MSYATEDGVLLVRQATASGLSTLSAGERSQYRSLKFPGRRRDWLVGRNALKGLLRRLGRSEDTSLLRFPNRQLSLTHSEGHAIAVGTTAAVAGIGVDYEPLRDVSPAVSRWFLNDTELAWLTAQPIAVRHLHIIRLWTVKEAAFKSLPANGAVSLHDLAISDPAAPASEVSRGNGRIRVSSGRLAAGYLSIAINRTSQ